MVKSRDQEMIDTEKLVTVPKTWGDKCYTWPHGEVLGADGAEGVKEKPKISKSLCWGLQGKEWTSWNFSGLWSMELSPIIHSLTLE